MADQIETKEHEKRKEKNQLRNFTKKNRDRQSTEAAKVNDTNNDLEASTLQHASHQRVPDLQILDLEEKIVKQEKSIQCLNKKSRLLQGKLIQIRTSHITHSN